jgi:drug/metabolite transporter (DMT)-like permease
LVDQCIEPAGRRDRVDPQVTTLGVFVYTKIMRKKIAVIGLGLGIFLSSHALKLISLGIAAAMLPISPVFMLLLDTRIVLKEKIRSIAILGTGLAVTGTVLLVLH